MFVVMAVRVLFHSPSLTHHQAIGGEAFPQRSVTTRYKTLHPRLPPLLTPRRVRAQLLALQSCRIRSFLLTDAEGLELARGGCSSPPRGVLISGHPRSFTPFRPTRVDGSLPGCRPQDRANWIQCQPPVTRPFPKFPLDSHPDSRLLPTS